MKYQYSYLVKLSIFRFLVREMAVQERVLLNDARFKDIYSLTR